jgi:hypothetical protein
VHTRETRALDHPLFIETRIEKADDNHGNPSRLILDSRLILWTLRAV